MILHAPAAVYCALVVASFGFGLDLFKVLLKIIFERRDNKKPSVN